MEKTREKNETKKNNPADRIPTLVNIDDRRKFNMAAESYVIYDHFRDMKRPSKKDNVIYCIVSVLISFTLGVVIGIVVVNSTNPESVTVKTKQVLTRNLNSIVNENKTEFDYSAVTFTGSEPRYRKDIYPKGLTEDMKDILKDTESRFKNPIVFNKTFVPNDITVLYDNVFWGPEIEDAMPQGYGDNSAEIWEQYIEETEVVKMEAGCGRMQNRLVTFKDGVQACVRYRQNTDQIQGEIFSFYVGRLLNLTNLAPSVVKIVDMKDKLWRNVANEIATAQWSSNRAVVITQYIPSLESATIPLIFRPTNRHLNKVDVMRMCLKENSTVQMNKRTLLDKLKTKNVKNKIEDHIEHFNHIDMKLNKMTVDKFLELAQWSDLIIFDYLTANLDRIVNNLFNYQWNINIMDGPAHNLARKMDSGLLVFLDNESGLLHGYRLLKKYNVYHSLMLDNLCVFRKKTVESLRRLVEDQPVGGILSDIFHRKNSAVIRDILPSLPEKNAKILHERISNVLSQVEKCEQNFR